MSLKSLIKNQKIRIDAHQRGNGHIDHWDNPATDIHVDKRTNTKVDGKPVEAVLRIPINSNRPVRCEVNRKQNQQASDKIIKEVRDAFSNDKVRRSFMKDLIESLDTYATDFASEEKITQTLERLADHFQLTEEVMKSIVFDERKRLEGLTIRFKGNDGKYYFITATENEIVVGEVDENDSITKVIPWQER